MKRTVRWSCLALAGLVPSGVIVACGGGAESRGDGPVLSATEALNVCNPACAAAWTDCQQVNLGTNANVCGACGAQGQSPCDASGPNVGCQVASGASMGTIGGVCAPCGDLDEPACDTSWQPPGATIPWANGCSPTSAILWGQPLEATSGAGGGASVTTCTACGLPGAEPGQPVQPACSCPESTPGCTVAATVSVDPTTQVGTVGPRFIGLSYERNHLAGTLFTGSNSALINLFKQLGPGILRIGGGSIDTTPWVGDATPAPGEEVGTTSVSTLFDFLDATGWTVLYGLPMLSCPMGTYLPSPACEVITPAPPQQGTSTSQQDEATFVVSSASANQNLYGFEIGQEPDAYALDGVPSFADSTPPGPISATTYAMFLPQWQAAYSVVRPAVPTAMFTGPAASSGTKGVEYYAAPFADPSPAGARGEFGLLTQHYYFAYANSMSCGRTTSSAWTTGQGTSSPTCSSQLAALLAADAALVGGSGMLQQLKTAATGASVPYRMAEGNSFSGGGVPGISDSQASALWLLDYLFANAQAGSTGVNMHGGGDADSYTPIADDDDVVCGSNQAVTNGILCHKTGDATVDPGVRPEYYALLMFALAGQGPVLHTTVSSPLNLTAYAITPGSRTTTNVVIVNKDATKTAQVSVNLGYAAPSATITLLTAPSLTSTNGLTLGGTTISPDSPWAGTSISAIASDGQLTVTVPPASAALVRGHAAIVIIHPPPGGGCGQKVGTCE